MLSTTSQKLIQKFKSLTETEKSQVRSAINEENFSHEEVFGHLKESEFSIHEALEYLDISEATFRREIKDGRVHASTEVGRSHLYALSDLKRLKKLRKSK